jgi:steroid delta-isomerase-like uncharacterized protein
MARTAYDAAMTDLRSRRETIVREHMDSENRHDYDATIATFSHPRYELVATGDVYDGESEVRRYFEETRTAFPDQRNVLLALHHADDAVIVELEIEGTHTGPLRGFPPTNRRYRCQVGAVFGFLPQGDRIIYERVYFDAGTILRQLGLASKPGSLRSRLETAVTHPWTVARAYLRRALQRPTDHMRA